MREIERERESTCEREGELGLVFQDIYPVEAPDEKEAQWPNNNQHAPSKTPFDSERGSSCALRAPHTAQDSIAPPCLLQLAMIENLSALVVALETHRISPNQSKWMV